MYGQRQPAYESWSSSWGASTHVQSRISDLPSFQTTPKLALGIDTLHGHYRQPPFRARDREIRDRCWHERKPALSLELGLEGIGAHETPTFVLGERRRILTGFCLLA